MANIMAFNNYPRFSFNDTLNKIPQKQIPAIAMSRLERLVLLGRLDITAAEFSGVTAYPYKYLPVMRIPSPKTTFGREGIVLPKGRIISAITSQSQVVPGGIPVPTVSGTIPQNYAQTDWPAYVTGSGLDPVDTQYNAGGTFPQYISNVDGSLISAPIDYSFFGYEEGIYSLLVPCNGGSGSEIPYSSLDDEVGLWNKSSDTPLQIAANIPIGIVVTEVYQDFRGAFLNYQTHDVSTVYKGGRVDIPFVDINKLNNPFVAGANEQEDVLANTPSGYNSLWRTHAFMWFDGNSTPAIAGALVKADRYGNYIVQSSSASATPTVQTVGRVMHTDNRFPKELVGMIQNYPLVRTPGVNTAGLPTDLYVFAADVLEADGQNYDAKHCLAAVQAGVCGYVRIQLGL